MPQPPHLTEAWESAYLQILIATLLFSLGIPAFIQQLAHEDIRHLAQEQIGKRWLALPGAVVAAAVALLLWFSEPSEDPNITTLKEWVASGTIILLPLALGLFLFLFAKRFNRKTIITNLTKTLVRRYRKSSLLDENHLRDLVSLGRRGKGGYEKQLVLDAFFGIATFVQEGNRYRGEELTSLISSLGEILDDEERPGDGKNYMSGGNFLRSILLKPLSLPDWGHGHYDDAREAKKALTDLGLASLKSQPDRVVSRLLDIGARCNSTMLFETGVSALSKKRFVIAIYALNKLEAKAEREATDAAEAMMPCESASRLLGLLAHFAATGGAAWDRAQVFFDRLEGDYFANLQSCLTEAHDYYYHCVDFQTADYIGALSKLLKADGAA